MSRAKASRALRYRSPADMPAGMRQLHERQESGYRPQAIAGTPKRSKYGAEPTVVDDIRFDSKAEARYYERLKLRVKSGAVRYFLRQVPFHLPGGVRYVVDFMEVRADGSVHWIDVKGIETAMFRTKKRLVESLYPVTIEVAR